VAGLFGQGQERIPLSSSAAAALVLAQEEDYKGENERQTDGKREWYYGHD
jgi:hypothetical protein